MKYTVKLPPDAEVEDFEFGYGETNDVNDVTNWQESPTFELATGSYYFFARPLSNIACPSVGVLVAACESLWKLTDVDGYPVVKDNPSYPSSFLDTTFYSGADCLVFGVKNNAGTVQITALLGGVPIVATANFYNGYTPVTIDHTTTYDVFGAGPSSIVFPFAPGTLVIPDKVIYTYGGEDYEMYVRTYDDTMVVDKFWIMPGVRCLANQHGQVATSPSYSPVQSYTYVDGVLTFILVFGGDDIEDFGTNAKFTVVRTAATTLTLNEAFAAELATLGNKPFAGQKLTSYFEFYDSYGEGDYWSVEINAGFDAFDDENTVVGILIEYNCQVTLLALDFFQIEDTNPLPKLIFGYN